MPAVLDQHASVEAHMYARTYKAMCLEKMGSQVWIPSPGSGVLEELVEVSTHMEAVGMSDEDYFAAMIDQCAFEGRRPPCINNAFGEWGRTLVNRRIERERMEKSIRRMHVVVKAGRRRVDDWKHDLEVFSRTLEASCRRMPGGWDRAFYAKRHGMSIAQSLDAAGKIPDAFKALSAGWAKHFPLLVIDGPAARDEDVRAYFARLFPADSVRPE